MTLFFNRVRVSTATVGVGTLALGQASVGYFSFTEEGVPNGALCTYTIEDGNNVEVGRGVYASGPQTLTRAQILRSKINGQPADTTPLSLSGSAIVFITAAAEDLFRGPTGIVDNAVQRTDGTTGLVLQSSGVIIDDSNNVSGVANLTQTGYHDLTEIAEPAAPAANVARLRAIDDGAGTTTFGMKDSAGNVVPVSHFKQVGTGAVTRTQAARLADVIFAADFGVVADNSNDDTAEMQAAIDAAIALSRPLYLPMGSIKTSAVLNVTSPICMIGCGHVMTVFKPTSTTANVFTIDCIEPVEFKDFGIDASDITMTSGAAIFVTNTASNRNLESQFTGLRIVETFYGIIFDRAAYWTMHRCVVQACKNAHVYVRNLFEDDEGDSFLSDCLLEFFDTPTSDNILLFQESSGGLKIHGCKFLGGYHGYHLGLAAGAQTLGPVITGNSFENQTAAAIFLGADNDATSFIARTVITGNEIASFGNGHGIQIAGSATSTWCRGVTISGNNITVDLNAAAASTANGILVSFATDLAISGNVIKNDGAVGTTIGIQLSAGVTRVSKALNIINGFNTALSDSSASPQQETFKGGLLTLDTYYAQGVNPGFWLDETNGGVKGAYVVLDGGDLLVQRRATAFGAFEANLSTLNLTTANYGVVGTLAANNATTIPAGGANTAGVKVSSTANFGVFFGSGAPTLSAAQGSLYLRSDGSSTSTRLYVNTNGTTGWTNVTTAA